MDRRSIGNNITQHSEGARLFALVGLFDIVVWLVVGRFDLAWLFHIVLPKEENKRR